MTGTGAFRTLRVRDDRVRDDRNRDMVTETGALSTFRGRGNRNTWVTGTEAFGTFRSMEVNNRDIHYIQEQG